MPYRWRTAGHLDWLCRSPQLLRCEQSFALRDQLPADLADRLARWDADPASRPAALNEPAHPRLGYYFERLYECVMTHLLGWQLLAKNLQVRDGSGRTLGELDFLLRNPETGEVEHHEIAVKFYLGYQQDESDTLWYGPNSRDRLDRKVRRLLEHQSRLTERPEARKAMTDLGIPGPVTSRIFMPGYLFYPPDTPLTVPDFVPADHLRGTWLYRHDLADQDMAAWVPLHKPHWLGPWSQPDRPDPELAARVMDTVAEHARPRLFAVLSEDAASGQWIEVERVFVVPENWPRQGC
ncbi:DUF1853 family protein [Marinobacter segnicrescens]|uniref:DUF1853 family protein n=1 Tax=Marinobacter segnicrescens TaxID=430453 RepID=UPI003A8D82EC